MKSIRTKKLYKLNFSFVTNVSNLYFCGPFIFDLAQDIAQKTLNGSRYATLIKNKNGDYAFKLVSSGFFVSLKSYVTINKNELIVNNQYSVNEKKKKLTLKEIKDKEDEQDLKFMNDYPRLQKKTISYHLQRYEQIQKQFENRFKNNECF